MGIKHWHLAVDDGEGQDVSVGAFAVAGKWADAVGMREGAGFAVDSAAYGRVGDFTVERAVDAWNGELSVEHAVDGLMVVGIAQHGCQCQGRQVVMGAEPATVVDDQSGILLPDIVFEKFAEICHAGIRG